jgi:hypothetical protein
MPADGLAAFFAAYRHDTPALVSRGAALPLRPIARDHRLNVGVSHVPPRPHSPEAKQALEIPVARTAPWSPSCGASAR